MSNGFVQQQANTPFTQVATEHIMPNATIPIPNDNPNVG